MKSLRSRLDKLANHSSRQQAAQVFIYSADAPIKPESKSTSHQQRVVVYLPDNKRDQALKSLVIP